MQNFFSTGQFTRPSGRLTLILLALAVLNYLVMVLVTIPTLQEMAGGLALFDMMPSGYDFAHATALLERLGEAGRDYYLYRQIPLDIVYPGLFALSFFTATNWLAGRWDRAAGILRVLAFLPIVAALADYLENFLIVRMIGSYSALSEGLVAAASGASVAKAVSTTVFFVAFLIMLILWGLSRLKIFQR